MGMVTFGESMVLFQPLGDAPFSHAPLFTRSVAGAESNLAIALSRLGLKTRWLSRLGTDPFSNLIESTLRGEGVQVKAARDPSAVFFHKWGNRGSQTSIRFLERPPDRQKRFDPGATHGRAR